MAKPLTLADAVGLVRRSRLLDAETCRRVADRAAAGDLRGATPDALFGRLTGDGLLTPFQARQLAAGRWRGLVLRSYKLLARIGGGGMGQVYLGEHLALGRRVAVKVLSPELAADPTARARLVREARAAAVLDHPNIVRVYDIDEDADPPFLVMEYIDGVSLQAAVAVAGTFRAEAAALVARQVAAGLQHAWANGLVHRDVKPANLLLDRRGGARVLDLGIVRIDSDPGLTAAMGGKQILGTVDYLAPEQAMDSSAVDARADVYGLGATLYFLLAGHPPFADGSPGARLLRKQTTDPPPIHLLRPDVPGGLSDAVAAMLARRPADRLPPDAVADALAPFARPVADFPESLFAAVARHNSSGTDGASTPASSAGLGPPRSTVHPTALPTAATATAVVARSPTPPSTKRSKPRPVADVPAVSAPVPTPLPSPVPRASTRGRFSAESSAGRLGRLPARSRGNPALWLSLAAVVAAVVLALLAFLAFR